MNWLQKNKWYLIGGVSLTAILVYYLIKKGGRSISSLASSVKANDWANDKNYWKVGSTDLQSIAKSVGITLTHNKGLGSNFTDEQYKNAINKPKVSWAVYDITNNKFLAQSNNSSQNIYAASVSKVVVTATAYNNNNGTLPNNEDIGKAIKLLVKSDNNVWDALVKLAGGDDAVNKFSDKMNYNMKPARRKGNSVSAKGMSLFWNDVLRNNFKGAESIFKITSSCQTSGSRSRKYLPTSSYVGGKTGSWNNQYMHDSAYISNGNKWYSITVLTDGNYTSDTVGLIFGGLFKQYCK